MGHTAAHWQGIKLVLMGPTGLNFNGRDKEDRGYGGHGGLPAAAATLGDRQLETPHDIIHHLYLVNLVEFKPFQTCNFDLRLRNSFCVNFELRM